MSNSNDYSYSRISTGEGYSNAGTFLVSGGGDLVTVSGGSGLASGSNNLVSGGSRLVSVSGGSNLVSGGSGLVSISGGSGLASGGSGLVSISGGSGSRSQSVALSGAGGEQYVISSQTISGGGYSGNQQNSSSSFSSGTGAGFNVISGGSSVSVSGGLLEQSAFSQIEAAILRAANPIDINETELITINGQTGIWSNKSELINWRGVIPITQYLINEDQNPEIIRKRTEKSIVYDQEVAIRYLRPPTPPPPGEILVRQEKNIPTPPAPPLIIRQQPPRPDTPEPLIVREAPPRPPVQVGAKVITISGKRLPPPPRKVVIERLAPLPSKPQAVVIERWLPYNEQKRRVIFQRNTEPDPIVQRPRNVIIQWEPPSVTINKEFRDLGVIRANPVDYVQRYGATLKSYSELPSFAKEIKAPAGVVLAADYVSPSLIELEGDFQALNLIDLDAEGLSEYRLWLQRFGTSGGSFGISGGSYGISGGSTSVTTNVSTTVTANLINGIIAELFATIDTTNNGRVDKSEAEKLLVRIYRSAGRSYTDESVRSFFKAFDADNNGFIDIEEFRRGILSQLVYSN